MSVTVTTSTGKQVTLSLSRDEYGVDCNIGGVGPHLHVTFHVDRRDDGFESFLLVPQIGNRRITVKLAGDDLRAAHALFDEAEANRKARRELDDAYESRRQRVLDALNK